jgi:hypothetical protein
MPPKKRPLNSVRHSISNTTIPLLHVSSRELTSEGRALRPGSLAPAQCLLDNRNHSTRRQIHIARSQQNHSCDVPLDTTRTHHHRAVEREGEVARDIQIAQREYAAYRIEVVQIDIVVWHKAAARQLRCAAKADERHIDERVRPLRDRQRVKQRHLVRR